ncbi:extracellular solute-binding protein [Pelagicoccus sp. NFK12]|uniref:Extracellular solute-binding protein n=1 Tax=Pelagicoccus enzymogenes TaxID=2773457 RepID=A0A927FD79_9BACT|nr:extracellular solute-binding protein [Pelagicoccus enzymogenes]MBD5781626.1 extracellular solute-binding protein [Pelagicoccus enzymogenes]
MVSILQLSLSRVVLVFTMLACWLPATLAGRSASLLPAKKETIRFATDRTNYKAAFEEIARRYEALHPNVEIELTFTTGNQLATYVRTREAAGLELMPDIYNGNMTKGYDALGKWVALTPYLEQTNPYTGKKFIDSFRELNVYEFDNYGGELYMLPLDLISVGIYYNKDIFEELELREPQSWNELLDTCRAIKAAGYTPFSMPGDFSSIWAGNIGWLVRALNDAYLRDKIPLLAAQPGDWDFDPIAHSDFTYDPANPFFDRQIPLNAERVINGIESGKIDFRSEAFRRIYLRLQELSQFFQKGYIGSDIASAQNAFMRQEAAMMLAGSQFIFTHDQYQKNSAPDRRFKTGVMWLPPIQDDPLVSGPIRGFFNGGTLLSVTKKPDPEHERRVMDFLMFIATPESGQLLHDLTLENGYNLSGPLTIKGVTMLPGLEEQYQAFGGNGVVKLEFRGLFDEQKSVGDFVVHLQDYLGGRTDLDRFLEAYDRSMKEAVLRLRANYQYDLDPTTRDFLPVRERKTDAWNPFDNGLLAIAILLSAYCVFALANILKAKSEHRPKATIGFMLLTPTILLLLVFNYWPAISSIYFSLTDWSSWRYPNFIGLKNFSRVLQDDQFLFGLLNMLILLIASVIKATVFPFFAAQLLLCVSNTRVQRIFRGILLFPTLVPAIVIVLIWKNLYNPTSGLINQTLVAIGAETFASSWLGEHSLALASIIFMGFPWVGAIGLLIYLASLMNISDDIKDAYALESDSTLARIRNIDIPLVRSETRLLIILAVIGSIQEIQAILLMTGGGPGLSTHVPAYSMYKEAFLYGNFGYGAAIGTVLFLFILCVTLLNLKFLKKSEGYS